MQVVEAKARSAAPREKVSELEREGTPPPGGLGAVKALTSETRRPIVSREEVTVFEPPSRFGYKLLSGLPLRDYNAAITLTEAGGGGTDITWRSQFDGKYPLIGPVFRRALQKFTLDAAERLAREAERETPSN